MKLLHDDAGSVALTTIALLPLFLVCRRPACAPRPIWPRSWP